MICQRCGYCCIEYAVVIVDDPALGIVESNLIVKDSGVPCKHLGTDEYNTYFCKIHNEPWYKETPCYQFTQIETDNKKPCRMGIYRMSHSK